MSDRREAAVITGLLVLCIAGPYLSGIVWPGLGESVIRVDHVLLPVIAYLLLIRALMDKAVPRFLYVPLGLLFLGWLGFSTLLYWNRPDINRVAMLAGADAYMRPVLWIFIASQVHDRERAIRWTSGVAILFVLPMAVVAMLQLSPANTILHPVLTRLYDATGGRFYSSVLNGGRAPSFMPLLSTLGMYALLILGLFAVRVRSGWTPVLVIAGGLAAAVCGVLSGSKVYSLGLWLLIPGLWLFLPGSVRARTKTAAVIVGIVIVGAGVTFLPFRSRSTGFSTQVSHPVATTAGGLESRYSDSAIPIGKVLRTGILDSFKDAPLTGKGLNVVNQTTDSFWLGLLGMTGIIGVTLYLVFLGRVALGLWTVRHRQMLARVLFVLLIVFAVAGIGFHALIQDRAGDAFWLLVGLVLAGQGEERHAKAHAVARA